jgi:prolyl-tRNA editing enzyme YbaK/EbsC (Cys-tRNA(Pro) deacylase)
LEQNSNSDYSEKLRVFLASKDLWYRFIAFTEPVETVEQAGRKVPVDQIAKSIIMIDSVGDTLIAIVPARKKVSYRKMKTLLNVRDVRLASREEVLKYSGYPAGGVPPFSDIKRVFLDKQILNNETVIVGGGDVNKLIEVKTSDIIRTLNPMIADISDQI